MATPPFTRRRPGRMETDRRTDLFRSIGSNWAVAALQIVVLVQLTPVQVHALGASAQGAWLTVASLTSVLGLLALGVPMASVRFIAGHVARREIEEANRAIAACFSIYLALGVAVGAAGAALSVFFEHAYLRSPAWQALGPAVIREARIAVWLSVAHVALGFVAQLPFGVLDAHEAFVARNGIKIGGLLLRSALVAGVLRAAPSLVVVGLIQIAVTAAELALAILVIRRSFPAVRFGLRGVDRGRLREILGFSLFAMLLNTGIQLSFQCDQLVIGRFLPPEEGTLFDVGNKFFPALLGVILGIGSVVMPAATRLSAEGDRRALRAVFLKWSKVAYSLALLVGAYLLVLAPELLAAWMGPDFAAPSGRVARVLMVAFLFFLPVRGVASPMLMGLGRAAPTSLAFLAMGVANVALSLLLVRRLGIVGVAVGTAVPCAGFAVLVAWLACVEVGVPFGDYLRYVVARPTLGILPPALPLLLLKHSAHVFDLAAPRAVILARLFATGVAMTALFAVTWILFVYRDDPYLDLFARLSRRLATVR